MLLNYACPPRVLEPLVPVGTVLDSWEGRTLVSLVGFRFVDTRVRGWSVPCHRTFEEVNLRFYVRREMPDGTLRRAVVFIKELVPRRAVAVVARRVYNEPYLAVPMSHSVSLDGASGGHVRYSWSHRGSAYSIHAAASGPAAALEEGSEAEFITEHYWGYNRRRDGTTLEYRVEHPRWRVWDASDRRFEGPASDLYGTSFGEVLGGEPMSGHLALGSEVSVFPGRPIGSRA